MIIFLAMPSSVCNDKSSRRSETTAPVGDLEIYYEIRGQREPLLMIMGLGGHTLDWGWVLPQELEKRYCIIMFDNRGAGRSQQPIGPYSIAQMARDTAGLMDRLGLEKANVFGVSMGGMIAQQLAIDRPQRVMKLVLGCTSPGGKDQMLAPREIQQYLEPRKDLDLYDALWWAAPAGMPPEFIRDHPEIVVRKNRANMRYPSSLVAYEAQLAAFRNFSAEGRLSDIQAPTLVLAGSKDVLIPPENSRIIAEQITGAIRREIDGAGHLFWISHPQETLSILCEFLG
jgi:3-oxoadipate enol-lactonase